MGASPRRLATEASFLDAYRTRRSRQHYDREVLGFRLADETYGIEMAWLREIIRLRPVTEVPRAPRFVSGIITLRGRVITVIDLRVRIGLPAEALGRSSRILIVEHENEAFGLVVDEVYKVIRLLDAQIEVAPLAGGIESEYLGGVARTDDRLIVLLDVPEVVSFTVGQRRRLFL